MQGAQFLIGMCFKKMNHKFKAVITKLIFQTIHTDHFFVIVYLQIPLGKIMKQVILRFFEREVEKKSTGKKLPAGRNGKSTDAKPALDRLAGSNFK